MRVSNEKIEEEEARGRGILNAADRKWLLMDRDEFIEEHSRQYWGQRRDKVADRVQNAFIDFSLLFEHLDRELYSEIFYQNAKKQREQHLYIQDTLAFLMNGVGTGIRSVVSQTSYKFANSSFWRLSEGAIKQHAIVNGAIVADVEAPEIHGQKAPRIEKIIEETEEGAELTGNEFEMLLQSDAIENDRLFEAVSEVVSSELQDREE